MRLTHNLYKLGDIYGPIDLIVENHTLKLWSKVWNILQKRLLLVIVVSLTWWWS